MKSPLIDDRCLTEVHRLLWMEPFHNRGVLDLGWSCRDHAFVVACLLRLTSTSTRLVHGKCMYVQGPEATSPPCAIGQECHAVAGHTWLKSSDGKIMDVSPRLE